ncbi:MAG: rod-binding protein [Desulfuromonadaceae bacterium]|nr:rod-binding protein [Desulfuromonas sp.]MDY0185016.1 rod-binding protein [Desulfuromonadaceae bacterium]
MNLHVDPRVYMNQSETFNSSSKKSSGAAMRSTCAEFEAIMLQLMFKSMRSDEPSDGAIEGSNAQMIYQDLLDGRIAQELAHRQSLGVGEQIYRQLAPTSANTSR